MWYNNHLKTVGKWGSISFLFGLSVTAFVFVPIALQSRILDSFGIGRGNLSLLRAYVLDTASPGSYQTPTTLKLDFNSVSKVNDITAPVNTLINSAINGLRLNKNLNMGTGTPLSPIKSSSQDLNFSKFFSSSSVSSNDVMSFLKEAAVTGINLIILVISITTQVLKGLLSVFK